MGCGEWVGMRIGELSKRVVYGKGERGYRPSQDWRAMRAGGSPTSFNNIKILPSINPVINNDPF